MTRRANTDLLSGILGLAIAGVFWWGRGEVGRLSIMFPPRAPVPPCGVLGGPRGQGAGSPGTAVDLRRGRSSQDHRHWRHPLLLGDRHSLYRVLPFQRGRLLGDGLLPGFVPPEGHAAFGRQVVLRGPGRGDFFLSDLREAPLRASAHRSFFQLKEAGHRLSGPEQEDILP